MNGILNKIRTKRLKFHKVGNGLNIVDFPIYVLNHNVMIGDNVVIYPNVTFFGDGDIYIGNNVKIGNNVIINATKNSFVRIMDNTIIAANTYIIDCNHSTCKNILIQNQGVTAKPVDIGEDVWIGASCVIGMGVEIGKGSVVGANSFVNKSIPEYCIAAGSPAKVLKKRL